ncbi:aminoacyl-tRNA hydrolase [candidate division KSB1 bacterium]|nr:aminoacyl-tRNA hydrolase [candidate division KSB1 bacterium]
MIVINRNTVIHENEIKLTATKSSGPGGQNVNKVNTRVTLSFDVLNSSLTEEQKHRLYRRLTSRINKEGELKLSSQEHRTQSANRKAVIDRFIELLQSTLRKPRRRKQSTLPQHVKAKRVAAKKHRGEIKKMRQKVEW